MRTKARALTAVAAAILLAALAWLSLLPDLAVYGNLMLVGQPIGAVGGISPATARSMRDEGLLLTYEIPSRASVQAIQSRHQVRVIGTNDAYLEITGHRLVAGGFFTNTAWNEQSRHAALNKPAAFALFGSTNIDGRTVTIHDQTWMVTGVIDDGSESLNVYLPSSLTGGYARSLLIRTRGGQPGWSYTKSILAGFGIREGEYAFVNLSRVADTAGERLSLALKITFALAIALLSAKGFALVKAICSRLVEELDTRYPREILKARKAEIAKAAGMLVVLALGAAAVLNLSLRILATVFGWREVSLPQWYPGADFACKIAWLQEQYILGVWAFRGYLLMGLIVVLVIAASGKRGDDISKEELQRLPGDNSHET